MISFLSFRRQQISKPSSSRFPSLFFGARGRMFSAAQAALGGGGYTGRVVRAEDRRRNVPIGLERKVPEGLNESPSGGPNGSSTSHGTTPAYALPQVCRKSCSISDAAVPSQRVRPHVCAAALEPALLPGAGVLAVATALAGGQTATTATHPRRSPPATRGGPAAAPSPTTYAGSCSTDRTSPPDPGSSCAVRVVTQQEESSRFL